MRPRLVIELETSRMPRLLRIYLVGCIAFAFGYLLLHVREPLRLNLGDPWSDADVMSLVQPHGRPLAAMLHGALRRLGVRDVGMFRLFALALSALGAWWFLQYARRIWGHRVGLVATALLTTSLLWMTYADSLHLPPIMHASCFLALWAVVRALETGQRRYAAAALLGSFACVFAAYDDWLFLPAGVLFTIHVKRGNPFARGNRRLLIICAAGGLAAIFASSQLGLGPISRQGSIDHMLATPLAALVRRYTLVFTPMFWVTVGYATWRALRAPSLTWAIEDSLTWMLVVAAVCLYVAPEGTEAPMLRAQPVLPFYAIGSAILIARLLESGRLHRALAMAWATAGPVWGVYILLSHPRSVLDRDDVAQVHAYLASHDRNDFVLSNLLSDGPIEAAFARHSWPAFEVLEGIDAHRAQLEVLELLESAGTDYVHAVIFTTAESRFVDRSLGQLVQHRSLPSVTGWPHVVRSKANSIIRDYDQRVSKHLAAVGAKRVLHLRNFDVYRVDRASVLEVAGRSLPVVRAIDFGSLGASKFTLLGWGNSWRTEADQRAVTSIDGYDTCSNPVLDPTGALPGNACETTLTRSGPRVIDARTVARAQLMIRVERACDLRLTLELAAASRLEALALELAASSPSAQLAVERMVSTPLEISINDFTATQCLAAKRVSFVIPKRSVREGINVVTLAKRRSGAVEPRADVLSLAIEPICEPAR